MPKIEIEIPVPNDMQVFYKTIAINTDDYLEDIKNVLTSGREINYDFKTDENDKTNISIYLKTTQKTLFFFKEEISHKVGEVKKEIVSIINEHNLLKDIIFSPKSIDINNESDKIDIYFNVNIKKAKFMELKKIEQFKNHNVKMLKV